MTYAIHKQRKSEREREEREARRYIALRKVTFRGAVLEAEEMSWLLRKRVLRNEPQHSGKGVIRLPALVSHVYSTMVWLRRGETERERIPPTELVDLRWVEHIRKSQPQYLQAFRFDLQVPVRLLDPECIGIEFMQNVVATTTLCLKEFTHSRKAIPADGG
jgi:hypothetical protein